MRHHFADLLDRDGDYWTIVSNLDRYSFSLDQKITSPELANIVTINKHDCNWQLVFQLPNIEEVTLDEPSLEQIEAISSLESIRRIRISHVRLKNINFLKNLTQLEECVFEYVSGFSDLSPLSELENLKSLHLENLRGVSRFDGLSNSKNLKYLHIDGTLDWNQPIEDLDFLRGLTNLEVLALGFVSLKSDYPAFLPLIGLKNLKRIRIGLSTLTTKEYAFIETALPSTICGAFGYSNEWILCKDDGNRILFLGKKAGCVGKENPKAKQRCQEFIEKYKVMKSEALEIIKRASKSQ